MKIQLYDAGVKGHDKALKDLLQARQTLESGDGPSPHMRGWMDPSTVSKGDTIERILEAATEIRRSDTLVVVGIGGSFLGAHMLMEAMVRPWSNPFPILFAGHHLDPAYHSALLSHLSGKDFWINVISKSGGTTEPAAAFRLLYESLANRKDTQPSERIIATTDPSRGALRSHTQKEGFTSFSIPPNVGGRFSVLTPVGLLPAAVAGIDIRALIQGAMEMAERVRSLQGDNVDTNPALAYGVHRLASYRGGKKIEVMASFSSRLAMFGQWWRQLFGESEGKENKGIFPSTATYSSDLHSLGQWMQEGERTVFETFLAPEEVPGPKVPQIKGEDPIAHIASKELGVINRAALDGTIEAHVEGGVPCARIDLETLDERSMGGLIYMMEYTCALCALATGVDPFNQPGVEHYKQAMTERLMP